jgi:hypothetical protein
MFFVIEVDNEGFKVYDSAGNAIDPAKDSSVTALGTLLTAIKNTDGIKKIVDALPTGDNIIGRTKITDGTNVVDVLDDSGTKRLRVDAKISGSGPATRVYLYDDVNNIALAVAPNVLIPANTRGLMAGAVDPTAKAQWLQLDSALRLKVTTRNEPTDITKRVFEPLKNGAAINMYVDGSVTPQVFVFNADPSKDIYVTQIRFVVNAADIRFKAGVGAGTFQALNALTNGLLLQVRTNSTTVDLSNFKRDEEFLAFGGNDILDQTDTSDLLTATYDCDGVKLVAASGDFVKATVRDNLTNAGHIFLACYVKGYTL